MGAHSTREREACDQFVLEREIEVARAVEPLTLHPLPGLGDGRGNVYSGSQPMSRRSRSIEKYTLVFQWCRCGASRCRIRCTPNSAAARSS
jgi:hypothetical protein